MSRRIMLIWVGGEERLVIGEKEQQELANKWAFEGGLCSQGWVAFGEKEHRELANKWAFEGEKICHGKPSGIDNTLSTFGNLIKFKSGALTCIKSKSSMILKMLITNTKVGRNTKSLVTCVSERMNRHPDAMASVFTKNVINTFTFDSNMTFRFVACLVLIIFMWHALINGLD